MRRLSKTDVMILSWPHNASSAPWSFDPVAEALVGLAVLTTSSLSLSHATEARGRLKRSSHLQARAGRRAAQQREVDERVPHHHATLTLTLTQIGRAHV